VVYGRKLDLYSDNDIVLVGIYFGPRGMVGSTVFVFSLWTKQILLLKVELRINISVKYNLVIEENCINNRRYIHWRYQSTMLKIILKEEGALFKL